MCVCVCVCVCCVHACVSLSIPVTVAIPGGCHEGPHTLCSSGPPDQTLNRDERRIGFSGPDYSCAETVSGDP